MSAEFGQTWWGRAWLEALPEEFTRQTRIYTANVSGKPPLEEMLPELDRFIGRDVEQVLDLVAPLQHHAQAPEGLAARGGGHAVVVHLGQLRYHLAKIAHFNIVAFCNHVKRHGRRLCILTIFIQRNYRREFNIRDNAFMLC